MLSLLCATRWFRHWLPDQTGDQLHPTGSLPRFADCTCIDNWTPELEHLGATLTIEPGAVKGLMKAKAGSACLTSTSCLSAWWAPPPSKRAQIVRSRSLTSGDQGSDSVAVRPGSRVTAKNGSNMAPNSQIAWLADGVWPSCGRSEGRVRGGRFDAVTRRGGRALTGVQVHLVSWQ